MEPTPLSLMEQMNKEDAEVPAQSDTYSALVKAIQGAEQAPAVVEEPELAPETATPTFDKYGSAFKSPAPMGVAPGDKAGGPPKEPALPPSWVNDRSKALGEAKEQANFNKDFARLGQSVTAYTERPKNALDYLQRLGGGGVSAPMAHDDFYDKKEKEADAPLQVLQDKFALEGSDENPDSTQSKFASEFFTKQGYPGIKTAAQAKKAFPWIKEILDNQAKKENLSIISKNKQIDAERKANEKKEADAKGVDALNQWKEVMRKRHPEHADEIYSFTDYKTANDFQNALEGDKTRAAQVEAAKQAAYIAAGREEDKTDQRRMDDYREYLSKRVDTDSNLRELDELLNSGEAASAISGLGKGKALLADIVGLDLRSPQGRKINQLISAIKAAILKERSGSTVTDSDLRLFAEEGLTSRNLDAVKEATARVRARRAEEQRLKDPRNNARAKEEEPTSSKVPQTGPSGQGKSHGAVKFERNGIREYEDGFIEVYE